MSAPLLSIGIYCSAQDEHVEIVRSLQSALLQKIEVEFEVLVFAHDSLSQQSLDYLLSVQDPKLKLLRGSAMRAEAYNEIVQTAVSRFVMWLNSNDILTINACQSQLRFLVINPETDIIYGDRQLYGEDKELLEFVPQSAYAPRQLLYDFITERIRVTSGLLMKKTIWEHIGMFRKDVGEAFQLEAFVRAEKAGVRFAYNDTIVCFSQDRTIDEEMCKARCRVLDRLVESNPIEDLFPMLSWEDTPMMSLQHALLALSLIYLKGFQFEQTRDLLNKCNELGEQTETKMIEALLHKAQGRHAEAANLLLECLVEKKENSLSALMELATFEAAPTMELRN